MALFNAPQQSSKTFHQPRNAGPLPLVFTKLKRDCHAHFGPVPMKHIGWGSFQQWPTDGRLCLPRLQQTRGMGPGLPDG